MLQNGGKAEQGEQPLQKPAADELSPEAMPAELRGLLSQLSEEGKRRLIAVSQQKSEIFQGPFPHPKHAAKYEELCPGFLERSLAMAEKTQAANIESSRLSLANEKLYLENEHYKIDMQMRHDRLDSRDTARAQYLGFAALSFLAALAAVLAFFDHEKIAAALFGAAVIGFLGKIFVSKFSQAK